MHIVTEIILLWKLRVLPIATVLDYYYYYYCDCYYYYCYYMYYMYYLLATNY